MCRMLAIMSKNRISSSFLHDFRLLAEKGDVLPGAKSGHKDGWGIVGYERHNPIHLGRQPTNAVEDQRYNEALARLDQSNFKTSLLAHLRKASPEYKERTLQNTAPFIRGKWSFAHNGTIREFNVEAAGVKGTTDSEKLFVRLLARKEASGISIEKAIERTVREVRDSYDYSSMTFLLSNGTRIYAYREYSNLEDSDYYNLMYAMDKDMVLITQQKIWNRDWVTVPNKNLLTVMRNLKVCSRNI